MWTLLATLTLLAHSSFSEEPVAVVVSVSGKVEWREEERAPWKLAAKGLRLYQGSELRTGILSRAVLVFVADGSRVLVNEDTELVVEAKGLGRVLRPTGRVRMFVGEVYSKVRSGREFEVETPVSVASVREAVPSWEAGALEPLVGLLRPPQPQAGHPIFRFLPAATPGQTYSISRLISVRY